MTKDERKEYLRVKQAERRARMRQQAEIVDNPEVIVDEPVIEVSTVDEPENSIAENRFKRQTCGGCKRVWNSYTLLTQCPYCRVATGVRPEEGIVDISPVDRNWDKERYPDREAWEIACDRAERARAYARDMPEHVLPSEEIFQEVEWQYWNEGIPAVKRSVFV